MKHGSLHGCRSMLHLDNICHSTSKPFFLHCTTYFISALKTHRMGGKKTIFFHIKLYSHYKMSSSIHDISSIFSTSHDTLTTHGHEHAEKQSVEAAWTSPLELTLKKLNNLQKLTDDSAPTYRWLRFTLAHGFIFYSYRVDGRPLQSELGPSQNKFPEKICCASVIIQSLISPPEAVWVSLQPNTAER